MQDPASVMIRVATVEDQPSIVSIINQAFAIETFLDGERSRVRPRRPAGARDDLSGTDLRHGLSSNEL